VSENVVDARSSASFLELDQNEVHRFVADVLGGMGHRVAINNIAGLEFALRDLAISRVVAISTSGHNVNDIGRVRVNLLLDAGWQVSFEDPDTIVFEPDANCLGIDDGRILRVARR